VTAKGEREEGSRFASDRSTKEINRLYLIFLFGAGWKSASFPINDGKDFSPSVKKPKGITKCARETESGGYLFPFTIINGEAFGKKRAGARTKLGEGKKVDKKPNFMVLLLVKNNRFLIFSTT